MTWEQAVTLTCEAGEQVYAKGEGFWIFCWLVGNFGPVTYPQFRALDLFRKELDFRIRDDACFGEFLQLIDFGKKIPGTKQIARDLFSWCLQDAKVGFTKGQELIAKLFTED